MYEPALLAATADFLASEARGGRALEFGIGTGRVALPLSERGVAVSGIDISADMIDQLREKPGSAAIETTVGDFATTVVPGEFSLVYVVFNSITNLLEQPEWVQAFRNASRHLGPAGRFVMEFAIPDLRRFPPGVRRASIRREPGPSRLRHPRRRDAAWRLPPLLLRRGPGGAIRLAVPVCVAGGAGPDGRDGQHEVLRPMGRLGPLIFHRRQPEARLDLGTSVAPAHTPGRRYRWSGHDRPGGERPTGRGRR